MEALVIVGLFVALALLAARFGHDSREYLLSAEEAFARHGVAWERNALDRAFSAPSAQAGSHASARPIQPDHSPTGSGHSLNGDLVLSPGVTIGSAPAVVARALCGG